MEEEEKEKYWELFGLMVLVFLLGLLACLTIISI